MTNEEEVRMRGRKLAAVIGALAILCLGIARDRVTQGRRRRRLEDMA